MKNSREKTILVTKCYLKCSLAHVNKLQPGTHYIEMKMIRLHDTNVWMWSAIILHAESTGIVELLVTC